MLIAAHESRAVEASDVSRQQPRLVLLSGSASFVAEPDTRVALGPEQAANAARSDIGTRWA